MPSLGAAAACVCARLCLPFSFIFYLMWWCINCRLIGGNLMARVRLMLLEFSSASTVNFTVLEAVQCWCAAAAACSQAQQISLSDSSSRLVSRWLLEFWSLGDQNSFYDFSKHTPEHLGHFLFASQPPPPPSSILKLTAAGAVFTLFALFLPFLFRLVALFSAADTVIDISQSQSVSVSVLCALFHSI